MSKKSPEQIRERQILWRAARAHGLKLRSSRGRSPLHPDSGCYGLEHPGTGASRGIAPDGRLTLTAEQVRAVLLELKRGGTF